MSNEKIYLIDEVCEILKVSTHTLQKWYQWERYELRDGIVSENYLPIPNKLTNKRGKPKFWTENQIKELQKFKNEIVMGRNGRFGKYSNPLHKKEEKTNE
jgi:hypothetical protein